MADIICDFLSVTTPHSGWSDLRADLVPVLDGVGASVEIDDGDREILWRVGEGTVKAKRYGTVMAVGATGAVLGQLRAVGLFGRYLAMLAGRPHKVTRIDAARDSAEDAAPEIARLMAKGSGAKGISLTRKRVRPCDITKFVHRREDAQETGTIYIGGRTAEVRAAVYDKREERLFRGHDDPGPLLRHELRLKDVGASLCDALNPEALFWHFMAPDVLDRPEGVPAWSPGGLGFRCDAVADAPTPAARLIRRCADSADLAALVRLAQEVGPYGVPMLISQVEKLASAAPAPWLTS